jgi:hypothetical protein
MIAGAVLMVGGAAGAYQKMSVSLERTGKQYVLTFTAGGRAALVRALFVSVIEDGKATDTICEWHVQHPTNPVVGKWVYGDALPPEYEKHGCAPLAPGLYRVQAVGVGAGGILDVRIDAAGSVQPQK